MRLRLFAAYRFSRSRKLGFRRQDRGGGRFLPIRPLRMGLPGDPRKNIGSATLRTHARGHILRVMINVHPCSVPSAGNLRDM